MSNAVIAEELAATLQSFDEPEFTLEFRPMTVQAVAGALTTLRFPGTTVDIPGVRKFSFTGALVATDTVWVLRRGSDMIILGKLA